MNPAEYLSYHRSGYMEQGGRGCVDQQAVGRLEPRTLSPFRDG